MKTVIAAFAFSMLSASVGHAVDLGDCAEAPEMKMDIMFAGATGDYAAKSPFIIKNKAILPQNDSQIVSKNLSPTKDVYRYKVDLGQGVQEERTLTIEKSTNGDIITKRTNDFNAQMEAAKKAGYNVDPAAMGAIPVGQENHYRAANAKCRLQQGMALKQMKVGAKTELIKDVYADAVLCDQMKEALSAKGRETAEACLNTLNSVASIFQNRQQALLKEGKYLTEPMTGQLNIYGGVAAKMTFCSPTEWKLQLPGLGAVGQPMNPAKADTTAKAAAPATAGKANQ